MLNKLQSGQVFSATGTASTRLQVLAATVAGATDMFITDAQAGSDAGTAIVEIWNATASGTTILWQSEFSTSDPFSRSFIAPLRVTGSAYIVVRGGTNVLYGNIAGFAI